MVLELCVGARARWRRVGARLEQQHRVHAFLGPLGHADDRRLAHAGKRVEHALDVLRKDVQSFRRHDHFLLATLDEDTPVRVALADVAGMQPAVVVDGTFGSAAARRA